ncbi:hypothetical protein B0H67DRAFT_490682 [Lasiosphaeris hirsuta]|uniref:SET domain-containing protein n=1 Tax=Lasiosphaeris hirsuta TaxID=260670 RepID=A0AA40AGF1_9PEZI|nr:hypothetical protein B0H67DRAFT_490682 [Lasiosphaeris hirsuta]
MVDYPAVLVGLDFLADAKPHHRRRIIKQAIGQLPELTRESVYGLSRGDGTYEVDSILGANSNSVTLADGELHVGVFPKVARINHSCRPNAYYRFSQRRLAIEMVAYVPIEAGQEILISYIPLHLKHGERRKYLKDNWGFECRCSLCHAPESEISESEGRRRQVNEMKQTLQDARRDGYYKDAITIAGDLLQFAEWEGIPLLTPEYHDTLADLYLLKGDMANATTYARMALNGWVQFGSVDDDQLENSRRLLQGLVDAQS